MKAMKSIKSTRFLLSMVLALVITAGASDAPPLTFKFTTKNVPGAAETWIHGINNAGVFVGPYTDKANVCHSFILDGKKLTKLNDPNGKCTQANNLNPNGPITVVGSYEPTPGVPRGFLYKNGKFTDVRPAGATFSIANGINDKGDIVGVYIDANNVVHGFLFSGGRYKKIDVPGSVFTVAMDINNAGHMVMYWTSPEGVNNTSIYDGKTYKTINVPGAVISYAAGLNNEDDVSYFWLDGAGQTHSALRHEGTIFKFDYPKAVGSFAWGINDKSEIVGCYQLTNNGSASGNVATYK
jgi:probable HAF family extracellular repeat protein